MVRRLSCNRSPDSDSARLSKAARWSCAAAALAAASMLAVAAWLTPEPRGLGTHEQLGLPPCGFIEAWQMRCPSCGMTTAWAHAVRGQMVQALAANVGGTLLAWVAMAAVPWALAAACTGRWLLIPGRWSWLLAGSAVVLAITLADWLFRLAVAGT